MRKTFLFSVYDVEKLLYDVRILLKKGKNCIIEYISVILYYKESRKPM